MNRYKGGKQRHQMQPRKKFIVHSMFRIKPLETPIAKMKMNEFIWQLPERNLIKLDVL